jgi:hypothetical protein
MPVKLFILSPYSCCLESSCPLEIRKIPEETIVARLDFSDILLDLTEITDADVLSIVDVRTGEDVTADLLVGTPTVVANDEPLDVLVDIQLEDGVLGHRYEMKVQITTNDTTPSSPIFTFPIKMIEKRP